MAAIVLVPAVGKSVASAPLSVQGPFLSRQLPALLQWPRHDLQHLDRFHPFSGAGASIQQLGLQKLSELIAREAFLLQIVAIALLLLTAPLIVDLTISVLGNLRRSRIAPRAEEQDIRLAVVVPAHNQEPVIARTLQSLETAGCSFYVSSATDHATSQAWQVQVFVVAHNCSDWTAAVAAGCGARVVALNNEAERSKGAAIRVGFEAARSAGANAFLVLDADSLAGPNLIAATRASLVGGAAATQCRVEIEIPSAGPLTLATRLRAIGFRAKNLVRARGRAGLGFSSGVIGNGFAVTIEALNRVPFAADELYENLEYHTRLVSKGLRVRWVDHAFVYAPLASIQSAQARPEARWSGRLRVASRATGRLVMTILRGRWRAVAVLAEAWGLPAIFAFVALFAIALVPFEWARIFAIALAAMIFLYALEAALLGPEPWRDLTAPFSSIVQFIRKPLIAISTRRQSRKDANWARSREAHHP